MTAPMPDPTPQRSERTAEEILNNVRAGRPTVQNCTEIAQRQLFNAMLEIVRSSENGGEIFWGNGQQHLERQIAAFFNQPEASGT